MIVRSYSFSFAIFVFELVLNYSLYYTPKLVICQSATALLRFVPTIKHYKWYPTKSSGP